MTGQKRIRSVDALIKDIFEVRDRGNPGRGTGPWDYPGRDGDIPRARRYNWAVMIAFFAAFVFFWIMGQNTEPGEPLCPYQVGSSTYEDCMDAYTVYPR